MYCQTLLVDDVKYRKTEKGSELYDVKLKDVRPKKDGGEYTAFTINATFWGSTQPCSEGEIVLISGDLVNDYWTDQKTQETKSKPVLKSPKILNMDNGNDITPKKEESEPKQKGLPF